MTEEEKTPEYIDKSIKFRGAILHEICMMELALNTFISSHFCGDATSKAFEMGYVILGDDRIGLNSKTQIFQYISETHYKEWLDDYVSIRPHTEKNKTYTLCKDLVYCIEQRNIFAHRVLDGDTIRIKHPNYIKNEGDVRFIVMKNDIKPIDYNETSIDNLCKLISHVRKYLIVTIK